MKAQLQADYRRAERAYWLAALEASSGNVSATARAAGFSRTALYRALQRCGIAVKENHAGDWNRPLPASSVVTLTPMAQTCPVNRLEAQSSTPSSHTPRLR